MIGLSFIINRELTEKYNWVDVKEIADEIINEEEFEIYLAQDLWNILMFSSVVKEQNIIKRELTDYQKGDVIIWLLTICKFIFDFKCIIELKEPYFDHDVGMCGFGTYRKIDLFGELEEVIEEWDIYLSCYIKNEVYTELNNLLLNGDAPNQEFYNVNNNCFSYKGEEYEVIYNSEREVEKDSIAKIVVLKEIYLRRIYLVNTIFKFFNYDTIEIEQLLKCYHWVEEYSDYNRRKTLIENWYGFKVRTFKKDGLEGLKKFSGCENDNYESIKDIENELEDKLEILIDEYFSFTIYIEEDDYRIFNWIEDGMYEL